MGKHFETKILSLYTNGGGEYESLTPIFHFTVFNTSLPLPIRPNELHLQNDDFAILSKLQEHSS